MENLKTMTGNDFSFRTEPEGTVSVLNSGYIITPEQARSCLHLISTNKSFFGDYERININFHDFAVPEDIRDSIVNTLNKISDQSERKNNK